MSPPSKAAPGFDERELLTAAVLASSARETADGFSGDLIEVALLQAATARGLSLSNLVAERELLHVRNRFARGLAGDHAIALAAFPALVVEFGKLATRRD